MRGMRIRKYPSNHLSNYDGFVSLYRMEHAVPLSYEQALSMGRTGRVFGSPVLM